MQGGETIQFNSDLGGGKTTFIASLVKALGSKSYVASPTFTVSKEYKSPKYHILHFDFYRLTDTGLIVNALEEAVRDDKTICLIEWGNGVENVLPKDRLVVTINKDAKEAMTRHLIFSCTDSTKYLMKGVVS